MIRRFKSSLSAVLAFVMAVTFSFGVTFGASMVPGVYVKASAVSSTENYTASTFYPKTDAFLNSSVSKSAKVLNNCWEYMMAWIRFVTGNSSATYSEFPSYNNPAEVLPGDVIQIQGHWLVVLDCQASGDTIKLRTAEGNWPNGSYTVGNGIYTVSGNVLKRNGSASRPFKKGYHIITSFYNAAKTCVDSNFYPAMYPDIKNAYGSNYSSLFSHYMVHGIGEGRVASPSYDVGYYLSANNDVKKTYGSNNRQAFYHYVTYGIFEKRTSSRFYNGSFYIGRYSDLSRAFGTSGKSFISAAQHFNSNGVSEHRQGISSFSVEAYRNNYSDLQKAFSNHWLDYFIHYLQHGLKEGRKTT